MSAVQRPPKGKSSHGKSSPKKRPPPSTEGWRVGATIELRTSTGRVLRGTIFSYTPSYNRLVIEEDSRTGGVDIRDVRIVNTATVVQHEILRPPPTKKLPALPRVSHDRVAEREKRATSSASERIKRGMSTQADDVFRAVAKSFECEWDSETRRIVSARMNFTISSPYRVEDVQCDERKTVEYVKQLVAAARVDE